MRNEFGKIITELAEKDDKLYLLVGDIGFRIFDEFIEKFPDRFFNLGICEQSIIGISAGMALEGLRPYVYTITPFLIERPFEQLKLDINQQNVNVKLVGYADYPFLGPSHNEINAEKLMSLLPNIVSYFPKNSEEVRKFLIESHENEKPAFISLKKDKKQDSKKVLVTGGAGYVGAVLVPKLIKKGYDVRVVDLMLFGSEGLDAVKHKCEIIKGDIRDEKVLEKCLEGVGSVIHLAAISNDPCGNLDPEVTKQVNLYATEELVKLAKKRGVKRFIHASSSSVYGIKEEPNVTEDLPLEPITIYSKTKAESEEIIVQEASPEFTTVAIRLATVCGYSPRQRLDVIVNIMASKAITNKKIIVNGGDQKRPNIHIEDITDLYIDLLTAPKEKISGQVFNFGTENHTLNELAEIVKKTIGGDIEIEKKPYTSDSRSYSISSEKIKKVLGITPKRTIRDAVLDLKKAFENNLIPNPDDTIYSNVKKMIEIDTK
ncbi:MAG: NAD-dependent epimerase/dehydratase family protein [archaeon]